MGVTFRRYQPHDAPRGAVRCSPCMGRVPVAGSGGERRHTAHAQLLSPRPCSPSAQARSRGASLFPRLTSAVQWAAAIGTHQPGAWSLQDLGADSTTPPLSATPGHLPCPALPCFSPAPSLLLITGHLQPVAVTLRFTILDCSYFNQLTLVPKSCPTMKLPPLKSTTCRALDVSTH